MHLGKWVTLLEYPDVIVPYGGKSLIQCISQDARVALIKQLDDNCRVYIDDEADLEKVFNTAVNATIRRYGV